MQLSPSIAVALAVVAAPAAAQTVTPKLEQQTQGGVTEVHVAGPGSWGEVIGRLSQLLADPSRAAGVAGPTSAEIDVLPPPLLLERGYRVLARDRRQGQYLILLAKMRMRWDTAQCRDATTGDASQIILQMLARAITVTAQPGDAQGAADAGQRILAEGSAFAGKASPWWVCSQGIDAMQAAAAGRSLTEDEWRQPPAERMQRRRALEEGYRQAFATMAAAAAAQPAGGR